MGFDMQRKTRFKVIYYLAIFSEILPFDLTKILFLFPFLIFLYLFYIVEQQI